MTELIIGYSIILIFFIMDFIIRKDKVALSINKTKDDKNTTKVIIVTFFFVIILAESLGYFHLEGFKGKTIAMIAIFFMTLGLIIRIYSMTHD